MILETNQEQQELIEMVTRLDSSMHETSEQVLNLQIRTRTAVAELTRKISSLQSSSASSSSSLVMLKRLQQQIQVIEKAASQERTERKSADSLREIKLLNELKSQSSKVVGRFDDVVQSMKTLQTKIKVSSGSSSSTTTSGGSSSSSSSSTGSSSSSTTSGSSSSSSSSTGSSSS